MSGVSRHIPEDTFMFTVNTFNIQMFCAKYCCHTGVLEKIRLL